MAIHLHPIEDGAFLPILSVNLYTDGGKIIIEKKQGLSEEEYEHLLDDAASYAKAMGIDERDCYQIVEEYMASLK